MSAPSIVIGVFVYALFVAPFGSYNGSAGIIAFDESRFPTFKNLPEWIKLIKKGLDPNVPVILVSTKADLVENPTLNEETIKKFMDENGIKDYYRTSAKSGLNIDIVFNKLVELLEGENTI